MRAFLLCSLLLGCSSQMLVTDDEAPDVGTKDAAKDAPKEAAPQIDAGPDGMFYGFCQLDGVGEYKYYCPSNDDGGFGVCINPKCDITEPCQWYLDAAEYGCPMAHRCVVVNEAGTWQGSCK